MALNCRSSEKPVSEPCGICESCTEIRVGNSVDVIEIDAATNRGIDEIRELREGARYRPARDRFKVYILDEAHQITDAAFNALLKTLEEPPDHIVFMLATTQPEDIPQTIRSRCQHFSFRAVKFDDIVGQLRDLTNRENIEADDDALALLAEAGDGSMRDALSILDQASASSSGKLTVDSVRNLVGAAPSHILEEVMQAVSSGASEDILRRVDHLISEGHSPTHFARQMVRFLRNATVAKIAGKGSGLLQISGEERERVARVAESFSEEDLTRHLQIMLRTHGELSYKREQRFHLELGLLKMAHAQRLLPLEQLLSEAAASPSHATSRQPAAIKNTAAGAPVTRHAEPNSPNRAAQASPFAADSARKSGSKPELSADSAPASGPRMVPAPSTARVVMGAAAPANMAEDEPESQSRIPTEFRAQSTPQPQSDSAKLQSAPAGRNSSSTSAQLENVRTAVLQALTNGNQRVLMLMLEAGEWALEGNELVISVEASATVIDMSLSAEARRLAIASASEVLGRAVKLKVVPGAAIATSGGTQPDAKARSGKASNGGGRSRAEQDPVVQRMREKFGAQIRTVIDYKEKR